MYQRSGVKTCKQFQFKKGINKTTADLCFNRDQPKSSHVVMSLFTGAGGLDLGLEAAGFCIDLCVELDEDARDTLKTNRPRWNLAEPGDIHDINPKDLAHQLSHLRSKVTLLSGGPPCQPFSKSANWVNGGSRGLQDPRAKTLQAYFDIVEAVLPEVLLLENVTGLTSNKGEEGLILLRNQLQRINLKHKTFYSPQVFTINAADYGVPQFRERVFVLASVDGRKIELPLATHGNAENLEPYRTCWDAMGDLDNDEWSPDLNPTGKWAGLLKSIPEGKNYLWHTPRGVGEPLFGWRTRYWSFLLKLAKDRPSWTIQAETGPATGPFHWKSRLLSTEEVARLQTFPLNYEFKGNRRSVLRQIGNAVPCAIGEFLGLEIRRQLLGEHVRRHLRLIPKQRSHCPDHERVCKVPTHYLALRSNHADHPGTGKGPGAKRVRHIQKIA